MDDVALPPVVWWMKDGEDLINSGGWRGGEEEFPGSLASCSWRGWDGEVSRGEWQHELYGGGAAGEPSVNRQ